MRWLKGILFDPTLLVVLAALLLAGWWQLLGQSDRQTEEARQQQAVISRMKQWHRDFCLTHPGHGDYVDGFRENTTR
jgi:hypothetical protein